MICAPFVKPPALSAELLLKLGTVAAVAAALFSFVAL